MNILWDGSKPSHCDFIECNVYHNVYLHNFLLTKKAEYTIIAI